MKKMWWTVGGLVTTAALGRGAWFVTQQQQGTAPKQSTAKQTDSTKQAGEDLDSKKTTSPYQEILEDYRAVLSFAQQGQTTASEGYQQLVKDVDHGLFEVVVGNLVTNPENWHYVQQDFNADGTEELLIGQLQEDGTIAQRVLYHLEQSKPTVIAQSYMALPFGEHAGFEVYKNGVLVSYFHVPGTGNGEAVLYEMGNNTGLREVTKKTFNQQQDGTDNLFGQDPAKRVDSAQLQWKILSGSVTPQAATSNQAKERWNQDKELRLYHYMRDEFGPSSGQEFQSYSDKVSLSYAGMVLPMDILYGTATQTGGLEPDFDGKVPHLSWSRDGQAPAGSYAVVAMYSDAETTKYPVPTTYLFTISPDGEAQVWMTQQIQGNDERKFYFRPAPVDLNNFFEQLVNE